jgi:hypothetical protein
VNLTYMQQWAGGDAVSGGTKLCHDVGCRLAGFLLVRRHAVLAGTERPTKWHMERVACKQQSA